MIQLPVHLQVVISVLSGNSNSNLKQTENVNQQFIPNTTPPATLEVRKALSITKSNSKLRRFPKLYPPRQHSSRSCCSVQRSFGRFRKICSLWETLCYISSCARCQIYCSILLVLRNKFTTKNIGWKEKYFRHKECGVINQEVGVVQFPCQISELFDYDFDFPFFTEGYLF